MTLPVSYDFDFESLAVVKRARIREKTNKILRTIGTWQRGGIQIGEELIGIKEDLDHGEFIAWLGAFFPGSRRTAEELMKIARVFECAAVAHLDITQRALLALAAPSVPESARQEAVNQATNGQHVGTNEARTIINEHRESTKTIDLPGQGKLFVDGGPEAEAGEGHEEEDGEEFLSGDEGFGVSVPGGGKGDEEDEEESSSPSSPPPPPRPVDLWKSDRILRHVRGALDRVDDVTRAVTAKEKNGGYGGIKASLARLTGAERLQLRAELENLIERLLRWTDQIEERFDEAEAE